MSLVTKFDLEVFDNGEIEIHPGDGLNVKLKNIPYYHFEPGPQECIPSLPLSFQDFCSEEKRLGKQGKQCDAASILLKFSPGSVAGTLPKFPKLRTYML